MALIDRWMNEVLRPWDACCSLVLVIASDAISHGATSLRTIRLLIRVSLSDCERQRFGRFQYVGIYVCTGVSDDLSS